MRFQVQVGGESKSVGAFFGSETDVAKVSRWGSPHGFEDNPHVRDALEFSRLASKRWRYYFRANATITSLAGIKVSVRRNPQAEVAFMLLAGGLWPTRRPLRRFCLCWRSWCLRLIVFF